MQSFIESGRMPEHSNLVGIQITNSLQRHFKVCFDYILKMSSYSLSIFITYRYDQTEPNNLDE